VSCPLRCTFSTCSFPAGSLTRPFFCRWTLPPPPPPRAFFPLSPDVSPPPPQRYSSLSCCRRLRQVFVHLDPLLPGGFFSLLFYLTFLRLPFVQAIVSRRNLLFFLRYPPPTPLVSSCNLLSPFFCLNRRWRPRSVLSSSINDFSSSLQGWIDSTPAKGSRPLVLGLIFLFSIHCDHAGPRTPTAQRRMASERALT